MNIINSIKDFDKIKVGYTVWLTQCSNPGFHRIKGINFETKFIMFNNKNNEDSSLGDLFALKSDMVFPCSPDQVQELFPEYLI
jgi:hypothetical protein